VKLAVAMICESCGRESVGEVIVPHHVLTYDHTQKVSFHQDCHHCDAPLTLTLDVRTLQLINRRGYSQPRKTA
jgi:hypothetical protein